jgi:hypothetical protein
MGEAVGCVGGGSTAFAGCFSGAAAAGAASTGKVRAAAAMRAAVLASASSASRTVQISQRSSAWVSSRP